MDTNELGATIVLGMEFNEEAEGRMIVSAEESRIVVTGGSVLRPVESVAVTDLSIESDVSMRLRDEGAEGCAESTAVEGLELDGNIIVKDDCCLVKVEKLGS